MKSLQGLCLDCLSKHELSLTVPDVLKGDSIEIMSAEQFGLISSAFSRVVLQSLDMRIPTTDVLAHVTILEAISCNFSFFDVCSLKSLKSLSLHHHKSRLVFAAAPQLHLDSFLLNGCRSVSNLDQFLASQNGLVNLGLTNVALGEAVLNSIVSVDRLEAVSFDGSFGWKEAALVRLFRACRHLKFLSLMSLPVNAGFFLELPHSLLQLFAPQCDDFSSLSRFSKSMEKLCVCFSKAMTAACFAGEMWNNLTILSLNGCQNIDDKSLEVIGSSCRSLHTTNFSRCNISHDGIFHVAKNGVLKELAVYDCVKVGSLQQCLENNLGQHLEVVIVAGCRLLGAADLSIVLAQPLIRTVDFSGTNLQSVQVVEVFSARKPLNLTRALFVDCKHVDAIAANAIITNSPKLEYLNLELANAEMNARKEAIKQIKVARVLIRC